MARAASLQATQQAVELLNQMSLLIAAYYSHCYLYYLCSDADCVIVALCASIYLFKQGKNLAHTSALVRRFLHLRD